MSQITGASGDAGDFAQAIERSGGSVARFGTVFGEPFLGRKVLTNVLCLFAVLFPMVFSMVF